jgi:hypothetical protein
MNQEVQETPRPSDEHIQSVVQSLVNQLSQKALMVANLEASLEAQASETEDLREQLLQARLDLEKQNGDVAPA